MERVKTDMLLDDLVVVDAEDIGTVQSYRGERRINSDLDKLARSLTPDTPVGYDVFAPYVADDS